MLSRILCKHQVPRVNTAKACGPGNRQHAFAVLLDRPSRCQGSAKASHPNWAICVAARRGLTLLEVIILLVLVLIFLGILVTFIGRQRENALRVQCANNLKRQGEAIVVFGDAVKGKGFLPAARIAEGYATWAVQLAPYLAAENPLEAWDLQKPYATQDAKARTPAILAFLCPARNRTSYLSDAPAQELPGALGDYACASGDGDPKFPWSGPDANGAIILGEVLEKKDDLILRWRSRTTFASLLRPKSATLLIGEKHVPLDRLGQIEAGDGSLYNGAFPASISRIGGPGYGLAPSPLAPFNTNFGSAHSGICQFLHADGHVDAYTYSMSEEVLGAMIRRE